MTRQELQRAGELNERLEVMARMVTALRREGVEKIEVTLANAADDTLLDPDDGLVLDGPEVHDWLQAERIRCQEELEKLGVSVTA
jgi:flagellar motor component MotA